MNTRLPLILGCGACAILLCLTARADIIHLKTGRIEGTVIKRAGGEVKIRLTGGGVATVKEADILGIEERKTARDIYDAMAAKLKADDAEGHYALATWCRDHGLKHEATAELVAVLKAEPDHARARQDLGHVKTAKGWLTREAAMREKGMVLVGGKWIPKEEAAKLERKAQRKRLLLTINAVVYKIHSGPRADRKKWEHKLAGFGEPMAAAKMVALLGHRSTAVRRAACASLAQMKHRSAVPVIVRRALFDADESVRSAAVQSLMWLDRGWALDQFDQTINGLMLQEITNAAGLRATKRLYGRIGAALQVLGTIRSVPGLIRILYPKVQITAPSGDDGTGGSQIGMSRAGGGAGAADVNDGRVTVGTGGVVRRPRSSSKYYFNRAAEIALKKITGQNLGVSPKAWRTWWKEHGIALLREAEAKERGSKKRADELLKKAIDGRINDEE